MRLRQYIYEAKELVYYRGFNPGDKRRIKTGDIGWDSYLFVTDSIKSAKWYGSQIEKVVLKPTARILREGTSAFRKLSVGLKGKSMLEWASTIAERAKAEGYDAVHFSRQVDIGTPIMNLDSIQSRELLKN